MKKMILTKVQIIQNRLAQERARGVANPPLVNHVAFAVTTSARSVLKWAVGFVRHRTLKR